MSWAQCFYVFFFNIKKKVYIRYQPLHIYLGFGERGWRVSACCSLGNILSLIKSCVNFILIRKRKQMFERSHEQRTRSYGRGFAAPLPLPGEQTKWPPFRPPEPPCRQQPETLAAIFLGRNKKFFAGGFYFLIP